MAATMERTRPPASPPRPYTAELAYQEYMAGMRIAAVARRYGTSVRELLADWTARGWAAPAKTSRSRQATGTRPIIPRFDVAASYRDYLHRVPAETLESLYAVPLAVMRAAWRAHGLAVPDPPPAIPYDLVQAWRDYQEGERMETVARWCGLSLGELGRQWRVRALPRTRVPDPSLWVDGSAGDPLP